MQNTRESKYVINAANVSGSELYMRSVAHDGNFKIDNVTMRNPDADVFLSPGEAMFVGESDFAEHLKEAPSYNKVSINSIAYVGYETVIMGLNRLAYNYGLEHLGHNDGFEPATPCLWS